VYLAWGFFCGDAPLIYTTITEAFSEIVMCGRSTYRLTWEEIVRLYRLTLDQPAQNTRARYNVCPTTTIDTIVARDGNRELVPMCWGLVPSWWSKPLKELRLATFNARAETVAEKPMFRGAFKRTRCLIPVSGYYEWRDTPNGKQPWYFTARDGSPALTIAGLWDEWRDRESGETLRSCTMIITEPNTFVAEVHDRMPVLLAEEGFEPWLSWKAGLELLKPAPDDLLQKWPVSRRVNSSRASDDDPTLIEEIAMA
jgi:putative SOS response-associated peptidase YedK